MLREAVRVTPFPVAEMVAVVEKITLRVLIVKVAVVAPAGMVMLAGTVAADLLLESVTTTPPVGARPVRVTVPVEEEFPPTTVVGERVSDERTGR